MTETLTTPNKIKSWFGFDSIKANVLSKVREENYCGNFRSVCFSLPSVMFRFLVTLLSKQFKFHFASMLAS